MRKKRSISSKSIFCCDFVEIPYFMLNEDWYFFNGKNFELTAQAPEEAKKSLEDFYKSVKENERPH